MANYVATLGNYGVRNQVSIVKGIEGIGETEKDESLYYRRRKGRHGKGHRRDAQGSKERYSLRHIRGFPVEVAGKTGTAEKDGYINPTDEVAYVKSHLSSIVSGVSWSDVEAAMKQLMKDDPERYPTENDAVDDALIEASGNKVTQSQIDKYKETYDEFAWVVTMAPADDPKIAVVVMLVQGGISYNAGPVAREIIGKYLDLEGQYEEADFTTKMQ